MSIHLRPAIVLTLWHPGGPRLALSAEALSLLLRARPDAVMVHGGPSVFREAAGRPSEARMVAQAVKAALPEARVWFGVGCDGLAKRFRAALDTHEEAVERIAVVARVAASAGAEALVFDAEGAWKAARSSPFAQHVGALIPALYEAARREAPGVSVGMTSFDQPTLHGAFPWDRWCDEAICNFAMPQVYAAPEKGMAPVGALPRRFQAHQASWGVAATKGWFRETLPRLPYLQGHSVRAAETIDALVREPICALWSSPARMDADGAVALEAALKLRRLGLDVEAFQREQGLVVDGICGPKTLAALGVNVE